MSTPKLALCRSRRHSRTSWKAETAPVPVSTKWMEQTWRPHLVQRRSFIQRREVLARAAAGALRNAALVRPDPVGQVLHDTTPVKGPEQGSPGRK